MPPQVTHELNDADERILRYLTEGRNLPQNLAERLDYSRQYVQNRLQMLKAADYVSRHGGGLYEITDDGRAEIGFEKESDDQQSTVERLEADLEDCREQLEQARADAGAETDDQLIEVIEDAHSAASRAQDRLPDDGPGEMPLEDAVRTLEEAIDDEH